jgi:hypothetical protein
MSPPSYEGRCHCGSLRFIFRTFRAPEKWLVRSCQCSFCRSHGARTTSDPEGSVLFEIAEPSKLQRYRFGTRSTDFLICRACGVYLGALLSSSQGHFATLNVNTIQAALDVPAPVPVSYDAESLEQRQSRREARWTPVTGAV